MTVDSVGKAKYITNDPGKKDKEGEGFTRYANSTEMRGYRLYRPTDDPSMVFFHLSGDVTMLITDPQGRRAGYDPLTRQTYNDIPGGTYISPESISDPEDSNISTEEESRFEGLNPLVGQYQVQIFSNSSTNYQLTQYSFDTSGTINGINNHSGALEPNESLVYSMEHSDQALPIQIASLDINKALFIDSRYKDMALISGKIRTSAGEVLSSKIEKYLQIKVGSFFKSIDRNQLKKTRHSNGVISYFYGSLGRKGLYIHITPLTGEFNLLINHAEIDTGDIDLTTDVMIQVDDVIAKGLVSFKNIRKTKKHEK